MRVYRFTSYGNSVNKVRNQFWNLCRKEYQLLKSYPNNLRSLLRIEIVKEIYKEREDQTRRVLVRTESPNLKRHVNNVCSISNVKRPSC